MEGSRDESCTPLPRGSDGFERGLAFWEVCASSDTARCTFSDKSPASRDTPAALATALEAADGADAVNELLLQAPLARCFSIKEGNPLWSLLDVLETMAAVLRSPARARLVGALAEQLTQRSRFIAAAAREERLLYDLLRETSGHELRELARLLDIGGHHSGLARVVHQTINDWELRDGLLAHFRDELARCSESAGDGSPAPIHVISRMGTAAWAWSLGSGHNSGPKHSAGPVPGALPLLDTLGGRVAFILPSGSAGVGAVSESRARRSLHSNVGIVEAAVLPCQGSGLQSSIATIKEYAAVHPEACLVFVGDTTPDDVALSEATLQLRSLGGVRLALLHDVVDELGVKPQTPEDRRAKLKSHGIAVVDTYAGAAHRARKRRAGPGRRAACCQHSLFARRRRDCLVEVVRSDFFYAISWCDTGPQGTAGRPKSRTPKHLVIKK